MSEMFMSYCPISSDGKIPGFEARIREFGERFWTPVTVPPRSEICSS
jgi:hypothetical protein